MLSPGLGLEAASGIPTWVCCDYGSCCPSWESAGRTFFSASEGVKIEASEVPLPWAAALLARVGGMGWQDGRSMLCFLVAGSWGHGVVVGSSVDRWQETSGNLTSGVGLPCFGGPGYHAPLTVLNLCCVHGLTVPASLVVTFIIVMSTYCRENNTPVRWRRWNGHIGESTIIF